MPNERNDKHKHRGPANFPHINRNIAIPETEDKKNADRDTTDNILRMNGIEKETIDRGVPSQKPSPPIVELPPHLASSEELERRRALALEQEKKLEENERNINEERLRLAKKRNKEVLDSVEADLDMIKENKDSIANKKRIDLENVKEDKQMADNESKKVIEENKEVSGESVDVEDASSFFAFNPNFTQGERPTEIYVDESSFFDSEDVEPEGADNPTVDDNNSLMNEKEVGVEPEEKVGEPAQTFDKTLPMSFELDETIDRSIRISSLTNTSLDELRDDVNDLIVDMDEKNKDSDDVFEFDDDTRETFGYLNNRGFNYSGADMLHPKDSNKTLGGDKGFVNKKTIKASNANKNPNAFFSSILGIGTPVEVRLPNSGFTIFFRHPEKPELIGFIKALDDNTDKLGYNTEQVSFKSFEQFHVNKTTLSFLRSLIISTTLDAPDPIPYILEDDFELIQLALTTTMYPNGVPLTIPCVGSSVLKDVSTACKNVSTGRIAPATLAYIDTTKITELGKQLLSRTTSNSITLDEYNSFISTKEVIKKSFNAMGEKIEITFAPTTAEDYLAIGEAVLVSVDTTINESFNSDSIKIPDTDDKGRKYTKEEKEELLGNHIEAVKIDTLSKSLLRKNLNVKSIRVGDNVFEDAVENVGIIDLITRNKSGSDAFSEGIEEYGNGNPTMVGLPVYTCGCGYTRGDVSGLIPINPLRLLKVAVMVKE